MKIKGAIFDLDGTLLDSMPVWKELGSMYVNYKGLTPADDMQKSLKPMSLLQAAMYFQANYGIQLSEAEILDEFLELVKKTYFYEAKLKEGAKRFLLKLNKAGVKLCIATATQRDLAEAALKRLGILDLFCGMVTCQEVCSGKDRPDIYIKALELTGTNKSDTLIFEDALYAVKTAKLAGFKVAGVYDKSSNCDKASIKALADFYISSFDSFELF